METIGKIRRRHKAKGESISAIARDLNLSRNTVKKYLNVEADPVYQREKQPAPKLGPFQATLETWLDQDSQRPKGQRRTARRLFDDLQREGYAGAYDGVQRLVKAWKMQHPGASQDAFVPLVYAAGPGRSAPSQRCSSRSSLAFVPSPPPSTAISSRPAGCPPPAW